MTASAVPTAPMRLRVDAPEGRVHIGARTAIAIALASCIGVIAFGWPLLAAPESAIVAHSADAPWFFALFLPALLGVVLASIADGGMNARSIAMLGVLSAVVCVLRPLGAGTAGIEPIWVVLVLGGRALGPGFGFVLGATSLASSALLTGGVGPWLPFQMMAAAWVGLGAGLLPRTSSGRTEVLLTTAYAGVATYAYGLLMNLWLWPFTAGLAAGLAFVPGAPLEVNLLHWITFSIATSLAFDIPRTVLSMVLVAALARPVLASLRRAGRRARFTPPAEAA